MERYKILNSHRIRKIKKGFGFIPHFFLRGGFLASLERDEIILYFFCILAANCYGVSYYGDQHLCKILNLSAEELQTARLGLIEKDLLSFDSPWYQLLELPGKPVRINRSIQSFTDLKQRLSEDN